MVHTSRREGLKEAETPESRRRTRRMKARRSATGWRGGIYVEGAQRGVVAVRGPEGQGECAWVDEVEDGAGDENAKRRRGPRSIPERRRKRFHFVFRTSPRRPLVFPRWPRPPMHNVGNPGPSRAPTTAPYLADWERNATSTLRYVAR